MVGPTQEQMQPLVPPPDRACSEKARDLCGKIWDEFKKNPKYHYALVLTILEIITIGLKLRSTCKCEGSQTLCFEENKIDNYDGQCYSLLVAGIFAASSLVYLFFCIIISDFDKFDKLQYNSVIIAYLLIIVAESLKVHQSNRNNKSKYDK